MNIQPIEIEKYCIDKYVKVHDEFGWTGEFKLSAKNILDIVIDLTKNERQTHTQANNNADTKQLIIADVIKAERTVCLACGDDIHESCVPRISDLKCPECGGNWYTDL